ncbi:hypothetical protein [Tumebacillus permanentifrigoris]|uniref:Uncharacterized protein n=1 Tax=Tumebacillus permanentifrigoris TaxID=378543 RepID=A0A316D796_9BACL|nr:hypothetical protein [Tumebacillus permanentifrigoris]PWK11527.1 hypothetical protein C7459_11056 [Tumebacillus permanentifrigoris]
MSTQYRSPATNGRAVPTGIANPSLERSNREVGTIGGANAAENVRILHEGILIPVPSAGQNHPQAFRDFVQELLTTKNGLSYTDVGRNLSEVTSHWPNGEVVLDWRQAVAEPHAGRDGHTATTPSGAAIVPPIQFHTFWNQLNKKPSTQLGAHLITQLGNAGLSRFLVNRAPLIDHLTRSNSPISGGTFPDIHHLLNAGGTSSADSVGINTATEMPRAQLERQTFVNRLLLALRGADGRQPQPSLPRSIRNIMSSSNETDFLTNTSNAERSTPFATTVWRMLGASSSSEPQAAMERFFTKGTLGAHQQQASISLLHRLHTEEQAITYERIRDRYLTLHEETTHVVPLHHRQDPSSNTEIVRLDHRQPESSTSSARDESRSSTKAVVTTPIVTVEAPTNPSPTDLSQVDIDRLVDRVYREFQKKLAFERSIRGI